jgi:hypothetical protein
MHRSYVLPAMLACAALSAPAQVSISIGLPSVNIGINLPAMPELVRVPDEPVYYAPRLEVNYFFFDGLYWVLRGDDWFASSWYNGPWRRVDRYSVPPPVLRVPVRYYRRPPAYFRSWRPEGPPHWGEHWGHGWEQRRHGWDHREEHLAPAPIPEYQRDYTGPQYPRGPRQRELYDQHYHYQPQDPAVQRHYQMERQGPGPQGRPGKGHRPLYPPPPGQ